MHPAARWRAPSLPPKNAASNVSGGFERLPPEEPEGWKLYLGRKVSIRYHLPADPEHPFSELIGVVSSVTASAEDIVIDIVKRTGEVVSISAAQVDQGKVFPS